MDNLVRQISHNYVLMKKQRAEYGKQVVESLNEQLTNEFDRGFSAKSLLHFIRFSEVFPDFQIVSTLSRQFSFSHFKNFFYIDDELKREFYIEMCRIERWSVRALRSRTDSMLFEPGHDSNTLKKTKVNSP